MLWRAARAILQHIPFIGRLAFRGGVPWKKAAAETSISVVLTSISIWIGVIALRFTSLEHSAVKAAERVVTNGELYLLASGAVSPLFYITLIRYRSDNDEEKWITAFPHGVLYVISSIIILGISIVFITLRSVIDHPMSSIGLSISPFISLSWVIYAFSLFLFFTATVHKNILEDTGASVFREDEREFGTDFRRVRDA